MMFLDDSENPNKFLDVIDSLNPSIMFKMEISDKELSLLDILIEKKTVTKNGQIFDLSLQTRWYFHLSLPMPDLIFFSEVDL